MTINISIIYNKKLYKFDILTILIETNRTTSYMITFVFILVKKYSQSKLCK